MLFKTALILACENGHSEIAQLLIEKGENDFNAKDDYLLHSVFVLIIFSFKLIFEIYFIHLILRFIMHPKMA